MAKIWAWAVIRITRTFSNSVEAFISEIEHSDENGLSKCKIPYLLEQSMKFGCKRIFECSISSGGTEEKHPVVFGKTKSEEKIPLCKDKEYAVLILSCGLGPRDQRIIKGGSKDALYLALGRIKRPNLPVRPRSTRRAI